MFKKISVPIVIFSITAVLVTGLGAVLFYSYYSKSDIELPQPAVQVPDAKIVFVEAVTDEVSERPSFIVRAKGNDSVVFEWENLPENVVKIRVWRKKKEEARWKLWKTIVIPKGKTSGSLEMKVGSEDDPQAYNYYGETITSNGSPVWESPPLGLAPESKPDSVPPGGEEPNPPAFPGPANGEDVAGTGTLPTPNPSSQVPPPPQTGSTPPDTSGATTTDAYFYTPKIEAIDLPPPSPTGSFWARHSSDLIEVGWQSLPTSTTRVIIYRSLSDSGPWSNLLDQQITPANTSSVIRLMDNTLYESYYYRMEVYADTVITNKFDPILLPSL